jgi:hypothetical protein
MEERRRLDLCYNCNEKFSREHKVWPRLFLLDLDDGEDEDNCTEPDPQEAPLISLHPIAGVHSSTTMKARMTMEHCPLRLARFRVHAQLHRRRQRASNMTCTPNNATS